MPEYQTVNGVPWWEAGNLPSISPPPGSYPNFVDPMSLAKWNVLTQSICLTVATLLILMRLYTKLVVLKNPGWDDYTGVVAYLLLIVYSVITFQEDKWGNGRHLWNVKGDNFTRYAKWAWLSQIMYQPAIFFAKLSIILLYLRVFKPILRTSVALHLVLWANFTFYFAGMFVETFQCMPIQKAWYPLMNGHCINQQVAQIASAIVNTISDIIILLLPVSSIWSLRVHKTGKIGLFVIFSFGIFGCAASTSRVVLFSIHGPVHQTTDGTWTLFPLALLSTAEITCALVCSCLPAAPGFFRHISGFKVKIIISTPRQNRKIKYHNEINSSSGNSGPSGGRRTPFSPFSPRSPAAGQALETIGGRPLPPLPSERGSPAINMHQWATPAYSIKSPRVAQRDQYDELDDLHYVKGDEVRTPPVTPPSRRDDEDDDDLEKGGKLAKMGFSSRR